MRKFGVGSHGVPSLLQGSSTLIHIFSDDALATAFPMGIKKNRKPWLLLEQLARCTAAQEWGILQQVPLRKHYTHALPVDSDTAIKTAHNKLHEQR